ncbi:MAG: histone deacetylase family protein [Caulobacterales bacterium]
MTLAVYTHPEMLGHVPPSGHPEAPARLLAVTDALSDAADLELAVYDAPLIEPRDLALVHPAAYVEALQAASPSKGYFRLDEDTWMSPGTLRAARRAAGAVTAATRAVVWGETDRAFCAVRPPGHHAGPQFCMGFCLYSNVAIGARLAQSLGIRRIAIVDFDVHHGNGTQAVFEADPHVLYASVHQSPHWPGTGDPSETGVGNLVNVTVPPFADHVAWRGAFSRLMARVDAFEPELIFVSAGFDGHARDSQGEQNLQAEDYAWATRVIVSVANAHARGRVVSSLEGGYDLEALGQSALAHVRALQGA